ncbi:hypothetical protein RRG08_023973 [Elysia crispata]|uniref:Uncharacterized protein n=1 Tax=Elysia crispata TaxID=231223 RepID=A0AAE1D1B1_9GAST|nr:hypothetical protein RRG08_023973 [Elysia crispata]
MRAEDILIKIAIFCSLTFTKLCSQLSNLMDKVRMQASWHCDPRAEVMSKARVIATSVPRVVVSGSNDHQSWSPAVSGSGWEKVMRV